MYNYICQLLFTKDGKCLSSDTGVLLCLKITKGGKGKNQLKPVASYSIKSSIVVGKIPRKEKKKSNDSREMMMCSAHFLLSPSVFHLMSSTHI